MDKRVVTQNRTDQKTLNRSTRVNLTALHLACLQLLYADAVGQVSAIYTDKKVPQLPRFIKHRYQVILSTST